MVTIVWVSFLSILLTVAILYSIFSPKTNEYDEDYESELEREHGVIPSVPKKPVKRKKVVKKRENVKNGNSTPKTTPKISPKEVKPIVKPKSTKKATPKTKSSTSKKVKPEVKKNDKIVNEEPKPKSVKRNKVSKTNDIKKSKKPNPKPKTIIDNKVTPSEVKVESKKDHNPISKPKIKGKVVNSPVVVKKDGNIEVDPKDVIKKTPKVVSQTINTKGFEFRGEFDEEELVLIKKFASMTQGQIIQTHMGMVIFNKWIKTKPKYDTLLEDLENRSVKDGRYPTYLMWKGKVTKILLGGKVQ